MALDFHQFKKKLWKHMENIQNKKVTFRDFPKFKRDFFWRNCSDCFSFFENKLSPPSFLANVKEKLSLISTALGINFKYKNFPDRFLVPQQKPLKHNLEYGSQ